jgi:AcrR family transcriptional regulator
MAERKRPRRTRERILETSLDLFNRLGEPNVTTADIADEMNISPGNLYYHFRNKDAIIGELFAAFETRVLPLLAAPKDRAANVEDLWLMLHLLQEQMWSCRFLYRDLDELASRNRRIGSRFGDLLRRGADTVVELCRGMVTAGTMRASDSEIAALAQNVVLVATYWQSFQRMQRAARLRDSEVDFGRGAYQVLSLIAPYLVGSDRQLLDRLGADYL